MRIFYVIFLTVFSLAVCSCNNSHKYVWKKTYFPNGKLQSVSRVTNTPDSIYEGPSISYYETGRKHFEVVYKSGKWHGFLIGYFKNGQVFFKEHYNNGVLNGVAVYYDTLPYRVIQKDSFSKGILIHSLIYNRQRVLREEKWGVIVHLDKDSIIAGKRISASIEFLGPKQYNNYRAFVGIAPDSIFRKRDFTSIGFIHPGEYVFESIPYFGTTFNPKVGNIPYQFKIDKPGIYFIHGYISYGENYEDVTKPHHWSNFWHKVVVYK